VVVVVGTVVGVGVGAVYVNRSADEVALVPSGVVTVMSTVPAEWAGDTTVIWVSLSTCTEVPPVESNVTAVAPVKSEPVTVTVVPPAVLPVDGETPVTLGREVEVKTYANP